jgi:hypothetical protein
MRTTEVFDEGIVVVINPSDKPIQEMIMITDPLLKSHNKFLNLFC